MKTTAEYRFETVRQTEKSQFVGAARAYIESYIAGWSSSRLILFEGGTILFGLSGQAWAPAVQNKTGAQHSGSGFERRSNEAIQSFRRQSAD